MLRNYFKIAIRNLGRSKGYSIINITGLSVGLACSILVLLYIQNELSYDRYHANKDRIYRLAKVREGGGNSFKSVWSPVPMGPAIEADFPEVEEAVRFWDSFQPLIDTGDEVFNEDGRLHFADPEVLTVFSFELVKGNPETALQKPGSVVLTESVAEKYFGDDEAVGKSLSYDGYPAGERTLTVTGIMKDLPDASQFDFGLLASMKGVETEESNWGSHKPIWTYLMLRDGAGTDHLEQMLPSYLDAKSESSSMVTTKVELEPLTRVHLYSEYDGGFKAGSSITYLYLFGIVGFLILGIACINFINLATARSINRAGEVGVRKTFGASRGQLIKQYIGETAILVLIAEFFGLLLLELILPVFNSLSGKSIELELFGNMPLLLSMVLLAILVSLLAGLYPAFVLSGFKPVSVLRDKSVSLGKNTGLRKGLVVFQFAISIVLIMATTVVIKQMDFVRSKNLGFDEERVVVLPYSEDEEVLLNEFVQNPDIISATVSQRVPVNTINTDGRSVTLPGREAPIRVESFIIDDHFLETYDIEVIAGRGLSLELASDTAAFLINEAAVKEFGWTDAQEAIGEPIIWNGDKPGTIVGVVSDFHMDSFYKRIEPMVMHLMPESEWWRTFISVKIRPGADLAGVLGFLESNWKQHTPQGAYDYFFIDQSLEELHRADQKLASTFGYVSALAIFIACLGLVGLVSFMSVQRNREIAIRKVLGAGIADILMLFNKEFLTLVLTGFVIAVPVAIYLMNIWLSDFAYRIDIGFSTVLIAGLVVLVIAGLTVSGHSVRAATVNPVESLKNE